MIYPIILCGGRGTRLWPKSRSPMPKQFVPIVGEESLFQSACRRVSGELFYDLTILTSVEYRFVVAQQLQDIELMGSNIILEPEPKNTGPSIITSCQYLYGKDKEAMVLVLPSDHYIPNTELFVGMVKDGLELAKEGSIVTFGVRPTRPETGYGYIEAGQGKSVKAFHEKPELDNAIKMADSKNFYWNSGIFLMRSVDLIEAASELLPKTVKLTSNSLVTAEKDLDFTRIKPQEWDLIESISIDKAIIEHVKTLNWLPFKGDWSDLGDWSAIKNLQSSNDKNGNYLSGHVAQINVNNSLIESINGGPSIGVLGLDNVVVIADRDAVLVADISKSQMVGALVNKMMDEGINEAINHFCDYRPWGLFEVLYDGGNYKVKRLVVNPNSSLSLQSHKHRSEHWVVTQGIATVTIENETVELPEGKSTFIGVTQKHRLANHTSTPVVIIEVQAGEYLGEDDIIRYADDYSRI